MSHASVIEHEFSTPGRAGAFSAPERVFSIVGKKGISRKEVDDKLIDIDAYGEHREFRRRKNYNPFYIYRRRQQTQADLIEVGDFAKENDGVKFLLVLLNAFSRKVWVFPLKNKSASTVKQALETWLGKVQSPQTLLVDGGKEFWNNPVKKLLRDHNIRLNLASGKHKAGMVERANKTLQILIYKYMRHNERWRYLDALPNLVKTYNRREHRTLGMSPNEAHKKENEIKVRSILMERYMKRKKKNQPPLLKIGDFVRRHIEPRSRISPDTRSYWMNFSKEIFRIRKINQRMAVPMYYLESCLSGKDIARAYYRNELQPIGKDIFKVEKVLRHRQRSGKREVLVKWMGFGSHWNSWIDATAVTRNYEQ